jgi:probable phosphomutase (TIGR03848 family)
MTSIILVRHGANSYVEKGRLAGRKPNVHLNKLGKKQAAAVGAELAKVPIRAIYSSPLERTMETAQLIAKPLGLKVKPRIGLIELDFGEWQDKKLKDLSKTEDWKIVQFIPSRMCFPAGETFYEAQYRIVKELDVLSRKHSDDEVIVCVSHADVIKLVVAFHLGMPIDLFQRLHIAPASLTILKFSKHGAQLLALNYESAFTLFNK